MGKNIGKNISENLRDEYKQKLLDHDKQFATDPLKTAPKRAIQKTAEVTGDMTGYKTPNWTTKVSRRHVSPEEIQKLLMIWD